MNMERAVNHGEHGGHGEQREASLKRDGAITMNSSLFLILRKINLAAVAGWSFLPVTPVVIQGL